MRYGSGRATRQDYLAESRQRGNREEEAWQYRVLAGSSIEKNRSCHPIDAVLVLVYRNHDRGSG